MTPNQQKAVEYLAAVGSATEPDIADAVFVGHRSTLNKRRAWIHPSLISLMRQGVITRQIVNRDYLYRLADSPEVREA